MAASLDGFIARRDGRVDWMETSDEFAEGATMDPEFVAAFLKTIDCYVMGSRTYETALDFEAKGFGWAYGDKPVFVLTRRQLSKTRDYRQVPRGRPRAVRQRAPAAPVPRHLVCGRRGGLRRMPTARVGRRGALLDPAGPDRRRHFILRGAGPGRCPPPDGSQSLQKWHGDAGLRGRQI